jgi:hypothetical protein
MILDNRLYKVSTREALHVQAQGICIWQNITNACYMIQRLDDFTNACYILQRLDHFTNAYTLQKLDHFVLQ